MVLARARVAEVAREGRSLAMLPHVFEALDEALEGTRNRRRRADFRASVAESFALYGGDHGGDAQALALFDAAIEDDPDNLELLDHAIDLAGRTDDRATAADLLHRRLALAAPHERSSLRKRLIAVASELDDREHQELARRELALALEQEPENAVLLRRAAVLERKLGDARAAAEHLGRLLELDEQGQTQLDDRDLLLLDHARLLRRAGQIDAAWEGLRAGLGLIPNDPELVEDDVAAQRWVLDMLELALELAPPTDRPRILDLLITHASGQRRGEALVERAAQALRLDERLADLWVAVDELDAPQKILAQIEQLLDDRDYEGLARLAEVAHRERDRVTEVHARDRLGRSLLADDDPDNAAAQLERAVELAPDRLDLRRLLIDALERSGNVRDAIPLLLQLLRHDRESTPDERGRLSLRTAELLRRVERVDEAAELLAASGRELSRANPELVSDELRSELADRSFELLRELGEHQRALDVALEQASLRWGAADGTADPEAARRLGSWLARTSEVMVDAEIEQLDGQLNSLPLPEALPRTRVGLLEAAVDVRPDDRELAERLEQALRELDDLQALEMHLRRQIDRHTDPELRAGLLERLLEVVEREGEAYEARELLEDLLALRPDHTQAMLTLGRLHFEAGDPTEARKLWSVVQERLAEDDPRFYRPAIELAKDALEAGEHAQARLLAERARALEPEQGEPLELLATIAGEMGDPSFVAEVLGARLQLDDRVQQLAAGDRAQLELSRALALTQVFQRSGDPAAGAAALVHHAAAEQLVPARTRKPEPGSSGPIATRQWLALAIELADLEAEARARAVLRESLGDALELSELIAEAELLDRRLDRPLAALERIEWGLGGRADERSSSELIDALGRLLREREDEFELAARGQRILRGLIKELEPGAARTRALELLVEIGRRLDDPASVAFGLDHLPPERVERGPLAELRDWAIRKLGRVEEEVGSIESRLASGGLDADRRAALVERLLALLDGELEQTARRLLELAEQAERDVAAALADSALTLLEPKLADEAGRGELQLLELGIAALRSLARYGSVERVLATWPVVEAAVREGVELGAGLRPLANLVELATSVADPKLGERADALLAEQLPEHPEDSRLMRGVWARTSGDVLLREGERGRTTIASHAAAWLEQLISRRELEPEVGATMFDALAQLVTSELDEHAAAAMLRERAAAVIDDAPRFAALLRKLEARRRWPELLSLLGKAAELGREPGDDPSAWLRLADLAGADNDVRSEIRARERAGELLGRAAKLLREPPAARSEIDLDLAERAILEFERALALEPDHASLRWRLGLALARIGRTRAAFDNLVILWEREVWSAAGVELGELALRCGELASELGEHARAVELLTVARTRAGEDWREYASEALFSALLELGDEQHREQAVELASARASELHEAQASVVWLRRAAALAHGTNKVELLARARELAPGDELLLDELEKELRALDDRDALENLLRERVVRFSTGARKVATLESLIELITSDRAIELRDDDDSEHTFVKPRPRHASDGDPRRASELVTLYEELLILDPDHVVGLLTVAADHHRRERFGEALELWARAEPRLRDDDPRLFEVARQLGEHRVTLGDHREAHRLFARALELRPDDLAILERQHELACSLDDPEQVRRAASALLERGVALEQQRRAELEGDVARAEAMLGRPHAAIAAFERAVALVERGSELHRDLVQRWLALLGERSLDDGDVAAARHRELAARLELRRALGHEIDREQALRELDLRLALAEWDIGSELLERLLIADPSAPELRKRLRDLDPNSRTSLGDRALRSLRRVVDSLEPGSPRDELGRTLALAGREAGAARTTLDALDRISGQAAAAPELLDSRVWALRMLDRVEDELGQLDARLREAAGTKDDELVLQRLLRLLEHDGEACATRLIGLAGDGSAAEPSARARVWLLESALELLREHAPERVGLGVTAIARLIALVGDPQLLLELDGDEQSARERVAELRRRWQQLAAGALGHIARDRRALEHVVELIGIADRAGEAALPGFAELGEMLLDQATVDFPDHGPLHELSRARSGGDPGLALERIERLADSHRMDPRGRARLYLGLAATLSDDPSQLESGDSGIYQKVGTGASPRTPRRKFLRDLAGYHANEPAIFAPMREGLRKLGAYTELLALLDTVGADAEQWLELAEDAGAGEDRSAEAAARRRAGLALLERVVAQERDGGLTDNSLDRACLQLGRALALDPEEPRTQYHYGRALERAGRSADAFAQLVPIVERGLHERAGVEIGPLARRCGLLALELGERERAAGLLRLAYDSLNKVHTRIDVAERLFELLSGLTNELPERGESSAAAQASALARTVAELIESELADAREREEPERAAGLDPLPWLERAARVSSDEAERARLYARAHALAPDDGRLADLYEGSLRALPPLVGHAELEQLLRRRVASSLRSGDRARTVALLERLLALLGPRIDGDPNVDVPAATEIDLETRARIRDRAELLEQLLRLAPDRLEARLELASLRLREGDREAAAVHWRALAQRLPSEDRRFLAPSRALARFAIDSGELEQARRWLERSLTIDPNDRQSLEQLLEVGRGLDQPELVLSTSATLLARMAASEGDAPSEHEAPSADGRSRAALLRERARAYERLNQPERALTEIRAAAAASESGSDDHIEAAQQWLRLATRDGLRVQLSEDAAKLQARGEAQAREQLRRALGDQLPARAYVAEAELLAERLERRGEAIELLLEGLHRHPGEADLLATFEELCASAGEQTRFVRSLADLLASVDPEQSSTRVRLGEKLARAARAIGDPQTCLDALESLPGEVSERPELLELRDWAVRGLGSVDEELERLEGRLLAITEPAPERLQAIVTRMLRLLGDAGEPTALRLLALAERDGIDPELARALARTALRVAREYAPERLGVALMALHATLERDSLKAIAAWWSGIESLALEAGDIAAILGLLHLASSAEFWARVWARPRGKPSAQTSSEQQDALAYGHRAERLAAAAMRIAPADEALHRELLRRTSLATLGYIHVGTDTEDPAAERSILRPDPELLPSSEDELHSVLEALFASLDALARAAELRGPSLAELWSQAIAHVEIELAGEFAAQLSTRIDVALREHVEAWVDDPPTYMALLGLLRERECWADVVDLLLWADERHHDIDLVELTELADIAGASGDNVTRRRARIELGVRRAAAGQFQAAASAFADALEVADDGWMRDVLQYRYGEMLARAGRADARARTAAAAGQPRAARQPDERDRRAPRHRSAGLWLSTRRRLASAALRGALGRGRLDRARRGPLRPRVRSHDHRGSSPPRDRRAPIRSARAPGRASSRRRAGRDDRRRVSRSTRAPRRLVAACRRAR